MDTIKRNEQIDFLKAVAILLVVFAHSIQCGSGAVYEQQQEFFGNVIYKFIYSFHMPLFMLISGFLFYFSIRNHTWTENLKSRITTLLIPIIVWSVVPFLTEILESDSMTGIQLLNFFVLKAIHNLWFLWAIFYCSLVVIAVNKLFKDSILVYLLLFVFILIIPDIAKSELYKFMYPYFVAGYLFNKYKPKFVPFLQTKFVWQLIFLLSLGAVFASLLLLYDQNSYIYITGICIFRDTFSLEQLGIDLFRYVTGFVGSAWVILLVKLTFQKIPEKLVKAFLFVGQNSLGIYIISGYILVLAVPRIMANRTGINYFVTIAETILILSISLLCSVIIKKVNPLNCVLLGGRK
jgi:fucose 4-O-acetylase-like acetyltransferase